MVCLAWIMIVWELQGITYTFPIYIECGKYEKEYELSYVACSRATKITKICIGGGVPTDQLASDILK